MYLTTGPVDRSIRRSKCTSCRGTVASRDPGRCSCTQHSQNNFAPSEDPLQHPEPEQPRRTSKCTAPAGTPEPRTCKGGFGCILCCSYTSLRFLKLALRASTKRYIMLKGFSRYLTIKFLEIVYLFLDHIAASVINLGYENHY